MQRKMTMNIRQLIPTDAEEYLSIRLEALKKNHMLLQRVMKTK